MQNNRPNLPGSTDPSPDGSVALISGAVAGSVEALDAASGKQLWAYTEADATIQRADWTDDGSVIFSTHAGTYYSLNAKTGEKIWSFETGTLHSSYHIISGSSLYFCQKGSKTNGTKSVLVAMDISSATPSKKWELETEACRYKHSSKRFPISNDGKFILLSGSIVDVETLTVWDQFDDRYPKKLSGKRKARYAFSPDSSMFYVSHGKQMSAYSLPALVSV